MRRRLLFLLVLPCGPHLVGCAVDDAPPERAPELARIEQATIAERKADDLFGQPDLVTGAEPSTVSSATAHLPAGLASEASFLWVADRDAHRVLGFNVPSLKYASALMGQADMYSGLPNRGGPPSATTLDSPAAVAFLYGFGYVAVADTGNHRVLLGAWGGTPITPYRVFGHRGDFTSNTPNDGGISRESLAAPAGVAFDSSGRLYVADTANHRILGFATPTSTTDADYLFGQADYDRGDPNRGGGVGPDTLSSPTGIATWSPPLVSDATRGLYVVDSGNHRVLHVSFGATKADAVYGQGGSFTTGIPAKGGVSASSLRDPVAVAVDASGGIWVADAGHHRVLHFQKGATKADRVLGQPTFESGSPPVKTTESSLQSPSGVAVSMAGDVYVADTGASRVLRFKVSSVEECADVDPCTEDRFVPGYGCQHLASTLSPECRPYACDLSKRQCFTECLPSVPGRCNAGFECRYGRCMKPCSSDFGCFGQPCVDGYCCDSACTRACGACNLPGKEGHCAPIVGPPVDVDRTSPKRACPGADPDCAGQCTGEDLDRCAFAPAEQACGAEFCGDGVAHLRGRCDGAGRCVAEQRSCAPFGCAANGCRTSCDFDAHCADGATCVDGRCVDAGGVLGEGGGCALATSRGPDAAVAWGLWAFCTAAASSIARRRRGRGRRR